MVRIKFKTKQDQINGFYELATKGRVRSLPDGIFEIADHHLKILEVGGITYEIVQAEEGRENETEALRNSLTVDV